MICSSCPHRERQARRVSGPSGSSSPCWRRRRHRAWTSPFFGPNSSPTIPTPCCGTPTSTSSLPRPSLLPGAQLRYFIRAEGEIVALLGFGASAWKTNRAILHRLDERKPPRNLHLLVNYARFLILPWIQCPNLASRALGLISRLLVEDLSLATPIARFCLNPSSRSRIRWKCYKAANWQYSVTPKVAASSTRLSRCRPIKDWIYPLVRDFRRSLFNE